MESCAYVDTSVDSEALLRGLVYVRKLLLPHFRIDTITNEQLLQLLKEKKTKNNEPLTTNSFVYILSIIKKKNPAITLTQRDLPNHVIDNRINETDEKLIKKAIFHHISFMANIDTEQNYVKHRLWYNAGIAVLLSCAVCLRSSELIQLTFENYVQILNGQPVAIRIKKRAKSPILLGNIELLNKYFPYVKKIVSYEKKHVQNSIRLINISIVSFNKVFKLTVESFARDENVGIASTLGMHSIRKIATTIILDKTDDADMAKRFMRHDHSATTLRYYDTGNYIGKKLQAVYATALKN